VQGGPGGSEGGGGGTENKIGHALHLFFYKEKLVIVFSDGGPTPAMKRYVYLALLLIAVAGSFLVGAWYNRPHTPGKAGSQGGRILYYVDPMNPSHTSDKPGIAPCGMRMEPIYEDKEAMAQDSAGMASMPPGTVKISTEKQQIIGVRVEPAKKAPWSGTIRILGRVVPDETRIYRINAATDGWIKKILPVTTGSLVRKDELLATFYAPEFFSAMKAYLYGLRASDRFQKSGTEVKEQSEVADASIENYRNALRNLGMTDHQLNDIMRTRAGGEHVEIRAPEAGFILNRNVTLGERFQRGTELYKIADLSHVWVLADVFENESWFFRPGLQVKVNNPTQNKTFRARISNVLPQFDASTRTLKVRIDTDNPGYTLRPDMFVDVEIPVTLPSTLTVPAGAVLDSGLRKTVFVDRGNGFFEPRQVETGSRLGARVAIIKGLNPGERIVVSGNFLIDSESKMKMAATGVSEATRRQGEKPPAAKDREGGPGTSAGLPLSDPRPPMAGMPGEGR
jgi:membrane fusion protein, copper/silver efflux system